LVPDIVPQIGYGHLPKGLVGFALKSNESINGLISRFFLNLNSNPNPGNQFAAQSFTYAICAFMVIHKSSSLRQPDFLDDEFSILLLVMYLVAPFAWEHHLVFVLPAIILVILRTMKEKRIFPCAIAFLCAFVLAWPVSLGKGTLENQVSLLQFQSGSAS
jgi:hypothetical protein